MRAVKRLLVAGATGRLGEAVLTQALARGGFDEVVALGEAHADLSAAMRGLVLKPVGELPPLHAAIIVQGDPQASDARSFHGRDAPFALVDAQSVAAIAAAAARAGAGRLVLIHPVPMWQQLSGLHRGLIGDAELEVSRLPVETIVLMRPLADVRAPGGHWLQRVANVYLSLQWLMMPRSLPTLTSAQVAQVAVTVLIDAPAGLQTLGAADIEAQLQSGRSL